jgi:iron complex outermembrane receptor protein
MKHQHIVITVALVSIFLGVWIAPVPATAEEGESDALQEVVVTAEHRSENLQKTPASVDVVDQNALISAGVTTAADLTKLVPALTSLPFVGPYANFTIRGMSNFATNDFNDNAVVVNEAGVPLVHPTGAHGLFYDLERVEVLKGPQGTEYGRNATGGVINVIPAAPTNQFGITFDADEGNYNLHDVSSAINIPLTDTFYTRLAVSSTRHDGYFQDGTSDEDSDAARWSFRYAPNEDLKATLITDVDRDKGVGNGAALLNSSGKGFVGGTPFAGVNYQSPAYANYFTAAGAAPRNPLLDPPFENNTFWGTTLDVEWATPIGNLTILPAHREVSISYLSDLPTFYTAEDNHSRQDSFEVRLASSEDQPFRYLVGAFYLHDILTGHSDVEQPPNLTNSYLDMSTRTEAVFTTLTYAFTDALRLSAGARFNNDKKTTDDTRSTLGDFPFDTTPVFPLTNTVGTDPFSVDAEKSWNSTTWKVDLDYDLTPNTLLYANVGTGFKAGGFYFGPPQRDSYEPEKVLAYTLGEKSRFLDNTLQFNAEAYYLIYRDQQIAHFAVVPGFGNVNVVDNVGRATIKGLDIDLRYLATRLTTLTVSGSFEHAIYDSFTYLSATNITGQTGCNIAPAGASSGFTVNCSGEKMPQTPDVVLQAQIDQVMPLPGGASLIGSIDGRYEAGHQTSLTFAPESAVPSYTRADASLTYQPSHGNWTLSAYVQNIGNSVDIESILPGRSYNIETGGLISAILLPPRTYGLRFHYKY